MAFKKLFEQTLYPSLKEGKQSVIILELGHAQTTKNKLQEEVEYLPIKIQIVDTGRPVIFNVFESQFMSRFINPIQRQVNPEGKWDTIAAFISELIEGPIALDCWVTRNEFLDSKGVIRSQMDFNFFEPAAPTIAQTQTNVVSEQLDPNREIEV